MFLEVIFLWFRFLFVLLKLVSHVSIVLLKSFYVFLLTNCILFYDVRLYAMLLV